MPTMIAVTPPPTRISCNTTFHWYNNDVPEIKDIIIMTNNEMTAENCAGILFKNSFRMHLMAIMVTSESIIVTTISDA